MLSFDGDAVDEFSVVVAEPTFDIVSLDEGVSVDEDVVLVAKYVDVPLGSEVFSVKDEVSVVDVPSAFEVLGVPRSVDVVSSTEVVSAGSTAVFVGEVSSVAELRSVGVSVGSGVGDAELSSSSSCKAVGPAVSVETELAVLVVLAMLTPELVVSVLEDVVDNCKEEVNVLLLRSVLAASRLDVVGSGGSEVVVSALLDLQDILMGSVVCILDEIVDDNAVKPMELV